jgi:sec-independent protein translocase protein TatB
MLDIGFSELVVIGVVALVVIGPERLPRAARTVGHLLGRFQRYVAEVKADINREMDLADLKKIRSEVEDAARSVERTVRSEMQEAEAQLQSAQAEFDKVGEDLKQAQAEVNQSLPAFGMPHMGAGAAQAAPAPAAAEPASDVEPSPQLDLGLTASAQPESAPARQG